MLNITPQSGPPGVGLPPTAFCRAARIHLQATGGTSTVDVGNGADSSVVIQDFAIAQESGRRSCALVSNVSLSRTSLAALLALFFLGILAFACLRRSTK